MAAFEVVRWVIVLALIGALYVLVGTAASRLTVAASS